MQRNYEWLIIQGIVHFRHTSKRLHSYTYSHTYSQDTNNSLYKSLFISYAYLEELTYTPAHTHTRTLTNSLPKFRSQEFPPQGETATAATAHTAPVTIRPSISADASIRTTLASVNLLLSFAFPACPPPSLPPLPSSHFHQANERSCSASDTTDRAVSATNPYLPRKRNKLQCLRYSWPGHLWR